MVNFVQELIGSFGSDLLAGFLEVRALKRFLSAGAAQTAATATTQPQQAGQISPPQQSPGVKLGGIWNLSDETAFESLMGKLDMDEVLKISKLVNKFSYEWQKRKFRASVGALNLDYVKKKTERKVEVAKKDDKSSSTKRESSREERGNVGVDFLRNLARLPEGQMMEVVEASGVLYSATHDFFKKIEDNQEDIIKDIQNLRRRVGGEDYRNSKGEIVKGTPYKGPIGEILEPWKKIWRSLFSAKKRS